jgi:predicted phage tail protein
MESGSSRNPEARKIRSRLISNSRFRLALFPFFFVAGCGAPGEPTPPSSPIPVAVNDLSAQQTGDAVQLAFTMPSTTTTHERLAQSPAIEVLRGALKPDGSPDARSFRTVQTIPGALVGESRTADKVQITNRISLDELRSYPGAALVYRIRTRASRRRASADSNTAIVRIRPVPERIASVQATVTESAIELSWSAPTRTSTGDLLPPISEYRVYRGEIDPAAADSATEDLSQVKWKSPLALLASTPSTTYLDTGFDFGKTYLYTVRTVIPADGRTVESADSVPAIITPRDVFPPAVPQGLIAAVIVGSPTNAPEVDLSWSINAETDLAGYRVYRSEQQDTPGQLGTPDLLLSPAYRDTSVQPGHRYWYYVTAVDRSGNESAPSAPVAAEVAQPSS